MLKWNQYKLVAKNTVTGTDIGKRILTPFALASLDNSNNPRITIRATRITNNVPSGLWFPRQIVNELSM
jgi:hypothetical protein